MEKLNFIEKLRQSAKSTRSLISFGMDPVIDSLPDEYRKWGINGFHLFMKDLLPELKIQGISPAMFKPNFAWWLCHDKPLKMNYAGSEALAETINLIRLIFPEVQITDDSKNGDIGSSSAKWAIYGYDNWGADAMTVHTYMGRDSVGPFTVYCNDIQKRGAYLLVKTTNIGASDFELEMMADGHFLYEHVAERVIEWAYGKPGVGAVTAGNSPEELFILGKKFAGKEIPLLIPGVGKSQGGDAKEVAEIIGKSGYELPLIRINLSSGLTHPWYQFGKGNPTANECISMIVETLRSLNEKVGYTG